MLIGFNQSFSFGYRPIQPAFDPLALNISIWYDATDAATFNPSANDLIALAQWNDKSGAARNAAPTGGASNKPVIRTNILNGNRIVRFDGIGQNLQVPKATWSASLSGFTIIIVARASTLTGTRTLTSTDQNGLKIFHNGTNWGVQTSGGTGISTVAGDTTNFHTFAIIYDGTASGDANRLRFRYDRANQNLSFTGTVGALTNAGSTLMNFGWYTTSGAQAGTEYFGGDIAEVQLYTRALTSTEISNTENYLKNKWSV